MMRNARKGLSHNFRATMVQISMRIPAVWSKYSLFVDIYYGTNWFCKRTTKAQISLRISAGWSGPALSANCKRVLFVRYASYINNESSDMLTHPLSVCSGPYLSVYIYLKVVITCKNTHTDPGETLIFAYCIRAVFHITQFFWSNL